MSLELDWASLSEKTETKRTRYRYEDVKDKVRKIAFDTYKSVSTPDSLWELREVDGTKYLFALYEDGADLVATSSNQSDWQATSDRDGKNVTLAFKNIPLIRFASAEHGFDPGEAEGFAKFLENRVQDKDFVAKIAKQLPEPKQALLANLLGSKN